MTDVQMLLCSCIGPKVEEKGDFLLRFVYHESLISSLKSLDVTPPKETDFDVMKADFKKHQTYGILAAAMNLAQSQTGSQTAPRPKTTKKVFESKILGGVVGQGDPKLNQISDPNARIISLMEKLVA